MRQATRILVSGIVQGVGFRYLVRHEADNQRIVGHVENLDDGTVLIECEGKREDIEGLVASIRDSKKPVQIRDIDVQYSEDVGRFKVFRIVPGKMENELVEGFATGAMYLRSIDTRQDQMLDKQDQMLDKQDQMLDKQDQTITEIRDLSSGIREMLDSWFERIENDISKIKSKLQICPASAGAGRVISQEFAHSPTK